MRHRFLTAALCLLLAAPATAMADEFSGLPTGKKDNSAPLSTTLGDPGTNSVFNVDNSQDLPPTDEYNDVPVGIMLSAEQRASLGKDGTVTTAAGTEQTAAPTEAVVATDYTRKLNYDAILGLYNKGQYAEVAKTLKGLADAGHQGAQELMGIMYRSGQGVEKDPVKAFNLLSKAAETGRPLAEHHLGVMYYSGEGVDKDPVEALKWLHLAILHYPDGAQKDRAKQDRDNIYTQLTRRDKDRAMQLTRDWLQKRGEAHLLDLQSQ